LGSISCMDKARAQGWQIDYDRDLFRIALRTRDPVILEYVIEEGCCLRDEAANTLLARGRTDNLMLLLDRGQFLSAASLCQLVQRGEFQMLREMIDRAACATTAVATVAVAKSFQVEILTRALQRGFDRSAEVCVVAAEAGSLPLLQCAVENGCELAPTVSNAAARNGHLTCLQYVHNSGCGLTLTPKAPTLAARGGYLACLQYLHEQGSMALFASLVTAAISADSVACVRYLQDHGCALECAAGAIRAVKAWSVGCLQYYHELAGPQRARTRGWDAVWTAAMESKNGAVRVYAQRNV
jgi:hypothetical protein